ncbi:MAG: glycosyltransferase family 4 protein [Roseitalea porphyridii]|uniref:glycosyltransferase family 4 protein n=1 Tax=Roseitalea porphyridii TaxID=1852022 RepID=UPI0032D8D373
MTPGDHAGTPAPDPARTGDPAVIVTCLKRRHSGVSTTISALLPIQAGRRAIGYVGPDLPGVGQARAVAPDAFTRLTLAEAIRLSLRPLADGRPRIWHVRRDVEMMLGLVLRDVLRRPIRLVFTSSAIRKHSAGLNWLIGRMDRIVATSPAAARFFPDADIIGHGVDVEHFRPARQPADLAKDTPPTGPRMIGIFGRVREEKGIHIFVRALLPLLPRFPDVTAVIGGLCQSDDAPYAEGLKREIRMAGLEDRFVWVGEIPPGDMPDWYRRVAITVCCPLYEGYGLTAIEAMASGCAVVASRTGAFASMVEDGRTGYIIAKDDHSALSGALEKLLADPALCAQMGRFGRERACALFSIEAEADGLERVYESVWRERDAARP